MSVEVLKQAKEKYDVIASLILQGSFPGNVAPAVVETYKYAQRMSQTIQEQIDGLKDAPSDRPQEDTAGVGNGGVPNKRRRKNRKQD